MVLTSNKHFILQLKSKQLNKDILMTVFNLNSNVHGTDSDNFCSNTNMCYCRQLDKSDG